jgi:F-type H+-transporting ATPase subunit epsilon
MKISVLTPERVIFQGTVISVKVPGTLGEFQVLKNHAPIVSSLEAGTVHVVTAEGEYKYFDAESGEIKVSDEAGRALHFSIAGGFIEVLRDEISLLVQGVKEKVKA